MEILLISSKLQITLYRETNDNNKLEINVVQFKVK